MATLNDGNDSSTLSEDVSDESLKQLILTFTSRLDNLVKLLSEEREQGKRERTELIDLSAMLKEMLRAADEREEEHRIKLAALSRLESRFTATADRLALQVRMLKDQNDAR